MNIIGMNARMKAIGSLRTNGQDHETNSRRKGVERRSRRQADHRGTQYRQLSCGETLINHAGSRFNHIQSISKRRRSHEPTNWLVGRQEQAEQLFVTGARCDRRCRAVPRTAIYSSYLGTTTGGGRPSPSE